MLGRDFVRVKPRSLLFAGANQPARRDLGISSVAIENKVVPVRAVERIKTPFCALVELARADTSSQHSLLVVAPLSGHFPVLLRDLILGLLPFFRVYVTDWINVRHVPADQGSFGLDTNIAFLLETIKTLPTPLSVVALCQGGVPALAATALLARANDPRTPASLVLIASPIDPLANLTGVAALLRSRPLSWFEKNLITTVKRAYPGAGRRVYPAHLHLIPLWTYLTRRFGEGGELRAKVLFDDGADPTGFPFLDLYTSIMDLDARFLLENTALVFQECRLREGTFRFQGERVDPAAITRTALLTIEGELDDIAAPGQTSAAHGLCKSIPERLRKRLIVPGAGHFSLFHGKMYRRFVLPVIHEFADGHHMPV